MVFADTTIVERRRSVLRIIGILDWRDSARYQGVKPLLQNFLHSPRLPHLARLFDRYHTVLPGERNSAFRFSSKQNPIWCLRDISTELLDGVDRRIRRSRPGSNLVACDRGAILSSCALGGEKVERQEPDDSPGLNRNCRSTFAGNFSKSAYQLPGSLRADALPSRCSLFGHALRGGEAKRENLEFSRQKSQIYFLWFLLVPWRRHFSRD